MQGYRFWVKQDPWLWLFPLVLGISSVLHSGWFYYSHDIPKWLVIDGMLSFFVVAKRNQLKFKLSLPFITLSVLVVWLFTSLFWADNIYAGIEFSVRFVLWLAAFNVIIVVYSAQQRLHLLVNSAVLASTIFSIMFIVERALDVPFNNGAFTPIGFTNNAGHVFNIWIPCLIFSIGAYRLHWLIKTILGLTLLVVLYVLAISDIRATVIGLLLGGILLITVLYLKRLTAAKQHSHNQKRHIQIGVLLVLSVIVLSAMTLASRSHSIMEQVLSVTQNPTSAYQPRLNMVLNCWEMLKNHPFGVGVNNFEYLHPAYAKAGTPEASEYVSEHQILRTPHNFIAKMFVELGWLGGALFTGLFAWLVIQALKQAWHQTRQSWLLVPTCALLFHALLSQVFLSPMSFVFSLLLFACLFPGKKANNAQTLIHFDKVSIAFLLIPIFSIVTTVSHFYHYQGGFGYNIVALEKSIETYAGNDKAWLDLSKAYLAREGNNGKALYALEQFLNLNPEHIYGRYLYGEILIDEKRCREAFHILERLLRQYPTYDAAGLLMIEASQCNR